VVLSGAERGAGWAEVGFQQSLLPSVLGTLRHCLDRCPTLVPSSRRSKLIAHLEADQCLLIYCGARYRAGMPISTSLTESAVNFVIGDRPKKKGGRAAPLRTPTRCYTFVSRIPTESLGIFSRNRYTCYHKGTAPTLRMTA
jgi:hypothetical protein